MACLKSSTLGWPRVALSLFPFIKDPPDFLPEFIELSVVFFFHNLLYQSLQSCG